MRKAILLTALITIAMTITACRNTAAGDRGAQPLKSESGAKTLIAFFSATGNTKAAAGKLADVTGGDIYEIEPEKAYTAADLNWHDSTSRSSVEMKNPGARPPLKSKSIDIAQYDTIYIGYPIWWYVCPRIINSFIESCDPKNKVIRVFATSGSSSIDGSLEWLRKSYPELDWKDGLLMNSVTDDDIRKWVNDK